MSSMPVDLMKGGLDNASVCKWKADGKPPITPTSKRRRGDAGAPAPWLRQSGTKPQTRINVVPSPKATSRIKDKDGYMDPFAERPAMASVQRNASPIPLMSRIGCSSKRIKYFLLFWTTVWLGGVFLLGARGGTLLPEGSASGLFMRRGLRGAETPPDRMTIETGRLQEELQKAQEEMRAQRRALEEARQRAELAEAVDQESVAFAQQLDEELEALGKEYKRTREEIDDLERKSAKAREDRNVLEIQTEQLLSKIAEKSAAADDLERRQWLEQERQKRLEEQKAAGANGAVSEGHSGKILLTWSLHDSTKLPALERTASGAHKSAAHTYYSWIFVRERNGEIPPQILLQTTQQYPTKVSALVAARRAQANVQQSESVQIQKYVVPDEDQEQGFLDKHFGPRGMPYECKVALTNALGNVWGESAPYETEEECQLARKEILLQATSLLLDETEISSDEALARFQEVGSPSQVAPARRWKEGS
uniref:Uncharacterized protein n=2 Tax=Pinguiococcus pyrenoidosus TaxID=172671 RepID=A0A6U0TFN5_9STRA|mmetsp:Transcript_10010/g.37914  ORF Transcript_10010/g.37914 Transcript_10010/m.37914 type:complete len:480 (+) Transcript_10010:193-1632(+)